MARVAAGARILQCVGCGIGKVQDVVEFTMGQ
jgi:hypothetical protein